MNGILIVILPVNFLNKVSMGRKALKMPAITGEPFQIPPPQCAHCSRSLNKPIPFKLLF